MSRHPWKSPLAYNKMSIVHYLMVSENVLIYYYTYFISFILYSLINRPIAIKQSVSCSKSIKFETKIANNKPMAARKIQQYPP